MPSQSEFYASVCMCVTGHVGKRSAARARRDDLEALGYLFVYFLKGILPWQNMKARNVKEKYEKIKEKKITTKVETLCEGLPSEFAQYITYCK